MVPTLAPSRARARKLPLPGGVFGRTQESRLRADVIERLALIPNVVPRRHDVDAGVQKLIADLPRDTESRGGVLGVRDHEVDAVMVDDG